MNPDNILENVMIELNKSVMIELNKSEKFKNDILTDCRISKRNPVTNIMGVSTALETLLRYYSKDLGEEGTAILIDIISRILFDDLFISRSSSCKKSVQNECCKAK